MAFNESSNLGPTMNWATHALYVTQHHDSEYSYVSKRRFLAV